MTTFDHKAPRLDHSEISDAIRVGVSLAREEWEAELSEKQIQLVDDRIDRKIDKVKLWLFASVFAIIVANFVPLIIMVYQMGSFTSEVTTQLNDLKGQTPNQYPRSEHDTYAREVDRRITDLERRNLRLETEVFTTK